MRQYEPRRDRNQNSPTVRLGTGARHQYRDQRSMTEQQGPTPQREPLNSVDALGFLSLATVTAGAAVLWGIGWALITFGGLIGTVYVVLEIVLPRPRRDRRNS